jgi:ribosomal protein S18 acetylase RimI-like enzyme
MENLMLVTINEKQHPDFPQKFREAVRYIFPILCYTPEQTEAFLNQFSSHFDGNSYMIEDEQGRLTFCRYATGDVHFIIPSVWEDRYTLVKEALLQLKQEFLASNSERQLWMQIDETPPSHNAYYAGLLPELGFRLKPRLTMTASQDLVQKLALPDLAADIQEIPYQADQLQAAIDAYLRAHEVNEPELSAEERADSRRNDARYITHVYGLENTRQTWTGLACAGELIGFSFGAASDVRMSVEEVAVVPEFHGQGLGRYLTIRCMQKLNENYSGPDKYFFLGTDRRWHRALKLYHRLGFTIDKIESYAILKNDAGSLGIQGG